MPPDDDGGEASERSHPTYRAGRPSRQVGVLASRQWTAPTTVATRAAARAALQLAHHVRVVLADAVQRTSVTRTGSVSTVRGWTMNSFRLPCARWHNE